MMPAAPVKSNRLRSTEVKIGPRYWCCLHRRRGDVLSASSDRRQDDAKPGAACLEAPKHISPIASAERDDAVAEARPILQLVRKFPSRPGVYLQPDIRMTPFKLGEPVH